MIISCLDSRVLQFCVLFICEWQLIDLRIAQLKQSGARIIGPSSNKFWYASEKRELFFLSGFYLWWFWMNRWVFVSKIVLTVQIIFCLTKWLVLTVIISFLKVCIVCKVLRWRNTGRNLKPTRHLWDAYLWGDKHIYEELKFKVIILLSREEGCAFLVVFHLEEAGILTGMSTKLNKF